MTVTEREKNIINKIAEALPKMTEFEKGYMVGVAESRATGEKREERFALQDTGKKVV